MIIIYHLTNLVQGYEHKEIVIASYSVILILTKIFFSSLLILSFHSYPWSDLKSAETDIFQMFSCNCLSVNRMDCKNHCSKKTSFCIDIVSTDVMEEKSDHEMKNDIEQMISTRIQTMDKII